VQAETPPPKPTDIIMRGMRVNVGMRVLTWHETGFEFVGRERTYCRAIICHMTGAENPPAAMYSNMLSHCVYGKRSPLSIHFCVDQKGVIYQMADAEMRGAHAVGKGGDRSANSWSVGIEFIGRGADWKTAPARGYTRPRAVELIHGHKTPYDELYDVQVASGVALIEKLCALYGLPMRVPEDVHRQVHADLLTDHAYDTWRGVLSHPHVEIGKADVSFKLMRAVQARGRELERGIG